MLGLILLPLSGHGGESWQGNTEVVDGVVWVRNPTQPVHPIKTIRAVELWRIDSDSDDLLFGIISKIITDDRQNIYLLDSQLDEVSALNPAGEFIRRIGNKGEGPGELQQPNSIFRTPGGDIGLTQYFPGKIIKLSPEGDPLGEHPLPNYEVGGRVFVGSARQGSEYLTVATRVLIRRDDGSSDTVNALVAIDQQGSVICTYHENRSSRPVNDAQYVERSLGNIKDTRWDLGPEDQVFLSNAWDRYEILVYSNCGDLERVITRDYESQKRPVVYIDNLQANMDEYYRGRTRRGNPITYQVSDSFRDIQQIMAREEGGLWVLSSRVYNDRQDHIATFDEFDGRGIFVRRIEVLGEGDYYEDHYYLCGDRLFVVTNQGEHITHDSRQDSEADVMCSIICYQLNN